MCVVAKVILGFLGNDNEDMLVLNFFLNVSNQRHWSRGDIATNKKIKHGQNTGRRQIHQWILFKKQLSPLLLRAYEFALQTGTWATTWNSSIITVIHKEGKDATECSSYRPISLLNNDHKIITSIIANRWKDIVPDIVDNNQCGFIPGRFLSNNIRRTLNIIDYAQNNDINLLLLTLDAEKAFDQLLWPFMFEIVRS